MKTPTEIIREIYPFANEDDMYYKKVLHAMRMYANAKLDEAAEKANTRYFKPEGEDYRMIVDKQSILSLKDKI